MVASAFGSVKGALPSVLVDGLLQPDALTVRIGQEYYEAFEEISIVKDIMTMASGFQISFADKWRQSGEKWPLKPGEAVFLNLGANKFLNGFIDRLDVRVSNDDRALVAVGRDKTADLIDCSAGVNTQTQFKNVTLDKIVSSYASLFSLSVQVDAEVGEPFKKVSPEQDESIFDFLDRLAKERGVLLISNEEGEVVITNRAGGSTTLPSVKNPVASFDFTSVIKDLTGSGTDLVQGQNIISANATYDDTERFQSYVVKGQSKGTDDFNGVAANQVTAAAIDAGVGRFRSKIVVSEGQVTQATAQQRAGWEAIVRAAQSVNVVVEVQGWLKADNSPWKINELVSIDAGFIGLSPARQMLVTALEFRKSKDDGTKTVITLTRPDAFVANPVVDPAEDTKSELGWEQDIFGSTKKVLNSIR